jgi:hypothetical protein
MNRYRKFSKDKKMKKLVLLFVILFVVCCDRSLSLGLQPLGTFIDPTSKQEVEVYRYFYIDPGSDSRESVKVAKFKNCSVGPTTKYPVGKYEQEVITLYEDDKIIIQKREKE